jgi:hypothetical protein
MARHCSFNNLIVYETYQRFFAVVRARERAHQDPTWELEGDWGMADAGQLPGQAACANADPTSPFLSVEGQATQPPKSESSIESWLSGKTGGPTV